MDHHDKFQSINHHHFYGNGWGLGLIFGAIFARKVAEHAKKMSMPLNYGVIGAAGYSGLMVWHGGFSGSSLINVADEGHFRSIWNSYSVSIVFWDYGHHAAHRTCSGYF